MNSSTNEENLLITAKRIRELEESLREEREYRMQLDSHLEAMEYESRRLDRFYEAMYLEWNDSELRRLILLAGEENTENRRQYMKNYSREVEASDRRSRAMTGALEKCSKNDGGER